MRMRRGFWAGWWAWGSHMEEMGSWRRLMRNMLWRTLLTSSALGTPRSQISLSSMTAGAVVSMRTTTGFFAPRLTRANGRAAVAQIATTMVATRAQNSLGRGLSEAGEVSGV